VNQTYSHFAIGMILGSGHQNHNKCMRERKHSWIYLFIVY